MDEIDIGNEQADKILAAQLKAHSDRAVSERLLPTGACHFCSSPLPTGVLFCPADAGGDGCREDWQRMKDAEKRNGRKY